MDLLGILTMADRARELVRLGTTLARGDPLPDWASDEGAFLRHFGAPHEAYVEIVEHLLPEQVELLHATLEVNPEAAVLWVLSMEEIG